MPVNKGWEVIKKTLETIKNNLHTINTQKPQIDIINEYIESKVIQNIKKIENGQYIKPLLKYYKIGRGRASAETG
jgi:disulfide oxidoreductase YuzD